MVLSITTEAGYYPPAYDINPVTQARGLHLNISDNDNSLDYDLAMSVTDFFQLNDAEAEAIKEQVLKNVANWQKVATSIGLNRGEQQLMANAFNLG